jgi:CubicO group peptidase (beta-lactamase class C family)
VRTAPDAGTARLVEVVTGQPFGTYLREHVFEPLGMRDSQ